MNKYEELNIGIGRKNLDQVDETLSYFGLAAAVVRETICSKGY